MKILQISTTIDTSGDTETQKVINIFGLGDDNKIYCWIWEKGAWIPNWKEDAKT